LDEAVRLWCELLLKSELDPDFERLVLSTPQNKDSALFLSAASKVDSVFTGIRDSFLDSTVESVFIGIRDSLLDSSAWAHPFRHALQTLPEMLGAEVCGGADCEACGRKSHKAQIRVRLRGRKVDALARWIGGPGAKAIDSGRQSGRKYGTREDAGFEFLCGSHCYSRASAYHDVLHFKVWASGRLRAAAKQLAAQGMEPADIADKLLSPPNEGAGGSGRAKRLTGAGRVVQQIEERCQELLEQSTAWNAERGGVAKTPGSAGRGRLRVGVGEIPRLRGERSDDSGSGSNALGAGVRARGKSPLMAPAACLINLSFADAPPQRAQSKRHIQPQAKKRSRGAALMAVARAESKDESDEAATDEDDYFGKGGLVEGDGSELACDASSSEDEASFYESEEDETPDSQLARKEKQEQKRKEKQKQRQKQEQEQKQPVLLKRERAAQESPGAALRELARHARSPGDRLRQHLPASSHDGGSPSRELPRSVPSAPSTPGRGLEKPGAAARQRDASDCTPAKGRRMLVAEHGPNRVCDRGDKAGAIKRDTGRHVRAIPASDSEVE